MTHAVGCCTYALVKVSTETAKLDILNNNAQVLYLFPVYEKKTDPLDGTEILKVRLVVDGSKQRTNKADNYASTPKKEELLILLHLIAIHDWDYYHVDETRAFLNSERHSKEPLYAILKGDTSYYSIVKALYGLRSSPSDYQHKVQGVLVSLGYKQLQMCSCIYIKELPEGELDIVLHHVDDYLFTGSNAERTFNNVTEFRKIVNTSAPVKDATKILGLNITRIRDKRIILISMEKKIDDLVTELVEDYNMPIKARNTPMKSSNFIITEEDFQKMDPEKSKFLETEELKTLYMSILGSVNWIAGIRYDILLVVLYLAWNTKTPRYHHLEAAIHCVQYLNRTKYIPLVLGGSQDLSLLSFCDASLGNGPNRRSIYGSFTKLNHEAGAISALATLTPSVYTAVFESELEAIATTAKKINTAKNILLSLRQVIQEMPEIRADNEAVNEFVQGKSIAKQVRHMELRLFYVKDQFKMGHMFMTHVSGLTNPANELTKVSDITNHFPFAKQILGLGLLNAKSLLNEKFYRDLMENKINKPE